jgi:hypothetical protein
MKIRLTDHFIRVRISPEDAFALENKGCIQVQLKFGSGMTSNFVINIIDQLDSAIRLVGYGFELDLPRISVYTWLKSSDEKIKWQLGETIISLEKDYPCEHQLSSLDSTFQRPE